MVPPVVLQTERLLLRPRRADEAAIYRRLWTERDPRVPPHRRIDADGRPSVHDIAARLTADDSGPAPGLLAVLRKDSGELIGYCGLVAGGPDGDPELAYELLQAAHGQGYATEAARAVVDWAKATGYQRLWASVWDWNVASRRVLTKLGFCESSRAAPDAQGRVNLTTVLEF